MPGQSSDDLLALFDGAPLNRRYWVTFIPMSAVFVYDFFDFLVVGYLLAVVGPEWHLTHGQSAVILYSGGIGAIVGALAFGAFSDAWGRKPQVVIGTFICAVSSGLIAAHPRRRMVAVRDFALLRRRRSHRGSHAFLDRRRRTDADPSPHDRDELLCRVCLGRRLPGAGDLGSPARAFRLARRRAPRFRGGDNRRAGLALNAGIGEVARRQRPV
jgi:hypothetical protein